MNSEKNNSTISILIYVLKLWLLTSLLSSITIYFFEVLSTGKFDFWHGLIPYMFYAMIFSLPFSIPAFISLGLIIKLCTKNKLILSIVSIVFVFLSIYLFSYLILDYDKNFTKLVPISSIYAIVLSILIFFVDIKKSKTMNNEDY